MLFRLEYSYHYSTLLRHCRIHVGVVQNRRSVVVAVAVTAAAVAVAVAFDL